MITINEALSIPESEVVLSASRSGGPGGQHVNKVSTRITLSFDLLGSPSLNEDQKRILSSRLAGRISKEGLLQIHSSEHRSQYANRQEALTRFAALLAAALKPRKRRRPTGIPKAVRERRLQSKARRARIKKLRSRPEPE